MVSHTTATRSFALILPFKPPISYPSRFDLSQRPLGLLFYSLNTAPSYCPRFFIFLSQTSIEPAGALDGHNHHDSRHQCFKFSSKGCSWNLDFFTDDEPGVQAYPENFTSPTQYSKPGERTVFRYDCHLASWYGCAEPKHDSEQHV